LGFESKLLLELAKKRLFVFTLLFLEAAVRRLLELLKIVELLEKLFI
jgi:hypothetical protein